MFGAWKDDTATFRNLEPFNLLKIGTDKDDNSLLQAWENSVALKLRYAGSTRDNTQLKKCILMSLVETPDEIYEPYLQNIQKILLNL